MFQLCAAALVLAVIVGASLYVEALWKKICIFLGLGIATAMGLWLDGETTVVHDVFAVDYVQFITIPVATVLVACLGLFALRVRDGAKLGWFLWLACSFCKVVCTLARSGRNGL